MEKSNSTFSGTFKSLFSIMLFMFFVLNQNIYAQCSLGVNNETQISLDQSCEATITPGLVLNDETTSCPGGIFIVEVQDLNEVAIPSSPVVTGEYINQTLIAKVIDLNSGNTGWGYINIEDKLAPVITCVDVTVACSDISNFQPTVVDACDPNPTVTLISQSETVLSCDTSFIKEIVRTYQATDAQGNVSLPCTQTIMVERIDLDAVVFPDDLSQAGGNPIQCDTNYPVDADGNPDPSFTGVPTLLGNGIFPTTDLGCNTIVTYNDLVLPSIGGVQKIMREWIVNEWYCNGSNTASDIQIIEIVDDEGPVVTECPANYSVSTTPGTDCEAAILLPAINSVDACGFVAEVDVTYPGGFLNNSNGGLVYLPLGINEVTYTFYDNNQNSTQCTFEVTVEDNTAPVVICDQNTVVSLSLDGTALVYAHSFDDGSYDDCSDIEYSVRRMDNGTGCFFDPNFGPTVTFCCSDIGNDLMVILRITDGNGNFNDCMVNVEVQDKLPPEITCPANITVECDFPYDPENLAVDFGNATSQDNCSATITEVSSINIDQCGLGTIVRTFTAMDPNGSQSCTQIITFINSEPFDVNDITWAADVTINECIDPSTLHPDQTGYPTLDEDACDKVGFDWDDKVFTVVNGDNACFKIIRTWEVLDWCQTDSNGDFLSWTDQQVIKVINTDDPVFTGDYSDLVECTFDNQCEDGFINLSAAATDACTNELNWVYRIDVDNDGSFEIVSNNIVAESIDASGTYPIGNHRIVYTAEDGCGNQVSQTQLFSIVNCKAPTPYCINGLAIELMPVDTDGDGEADSGMIETWASDFDAGSFHSCGLPVTVSFSADPSDNVRMYTCDDFGDNTVEIWANVILPNGEILQDFCTANVDIQANNGICGPLTDNLVYVAGDIENEMKEKTNDVEVVLQGAELVTSTDGSGAYSFPSMPTGGQYEVIPTKEETDPLNGITTLDIVLIQKHILGIQTLDSPYKIIAADVNNDQKVSGADIVSIRKLILGVNTELIDNKDWRFVDASYNFINPENPLNESFNETYEIQELSADMDVDFVSVKTADVNNSAKFNLTSDNADTRSNETLTLAALDKSFKAGEEVSVELTVAEAVELYGLQYTLKFNNMELSFDRIESDVFPMIANSTVGTSWVDQGLVTVSASDSRITELNADEVLFTVYFTATSNGQLAGNINVTSDITTIEAYNKHLEVMDMDIVFRSENGSELSSTPFALYPNVPNPFNETTNISFNLPESTNVTLSVFDVSGKLIYAQNGAYAKGMNTVELNVSTFNASGVLYYQVETNEYTATRKMIVLK